MVRSLEPGGHPSAELALGSRGVMNRRTLSEIEIRSGEEARIMVDSTIRNPALPAILMLATVGLASPVAGQVELRQDIRIGTSTGAEKYQFYRVRGVVELSTGEIVVLNAGGPDVRIYSGQGRFVRSMGRRGPGPGEFQSPFWLSAAGDEILVLDLSGRLERFGIDGTHRGSVALSGEAVGNGSPLGLVAGYVILLHIPGRTPCPSSERERGCRETRTVRRLSLATGQVGPDLLRHESGRRFPSTGPALVFADAPLFEGLPSLAVDGRGRMYLSRAPEYRIDVFSPEGGPEHVFAPADYKARAVQQRDIEMYVQCMKEAVRAKDQPFQIDARIALPRAAHLPALGSMLVSQEGTIWIERVDLDPEPGEWECDRTAHLRRPRRTVWERMDGDGKSLGLVRVPSRFRPLSVTRDAMLGVETDAEDVEYVARYVVPKN